MFSADRGRRCATRWRAFCHACSELLFCIGLVLLPPLLVADTALWLGCRDLNRTECVELFVLSIAQSGSDFGPNSSAIPRTSVYKERPRR